MKSRNRIQTLKESIIYNYNTVKFIMQKSAKVKSVLPWS